MSWKDSLDEMIARMPALEAAWTPFRERLLLSRYRKRREHYHAKCAELGKAYREADVIQQVRDRIRRRGHTVRARALGEIHTFAFIPRIGWHPSLYDDLRVLGPVSEYDYVRAGYTTQALYRADRIGREQRARLNAEILPSIERAHRGRPVDWVFIYANGMEILPSTVRAITERTGITTVNMCFDDKHSWTGPWNGEARGGQIDLAPEFDLSWTSSRVACEWYIAVGGRPLYMPEGCSPSEFTPMRVEQDIPVSFMGARYGFRRGVIRFLGRRGIEVQTYGRGWSRGPWAEPPAVLFNRSRINLGMGGIGYSESLTSVKGRDFEIPCTGGGLYITTFNPDLALHFHVGREIVCYRAREEIVELVRHYLAREDESREIAAAGRERCLREHRWIHRYVKVCQALGLLDGSVAPAVLVASHDPAYATGDSRTA